MGDLQLNLQQVPQMMRDAAMELGPPVVTSVVKYDEPDGKGKFIVIRNGYTTEHLDGPKRNKRAHQFSDVMSFAQYLRRHAADDMETVEILGNAERIEAALDPKDVDTDRLVCNLEFHPRLKPWLAMFGKPTAQRDMWMFIRGRLKDFGKARTIDGEEIDYGPVLARELQKLEVTTGGTIDLQMDAGGSVNFVNVSQTTRTNGRLPSSFNIVLPVYRNVMLAPAGTNELAEPTYSLDVFLSYKAVKDGDAQKVVLTLECPGLDQTKQDAQEDAQECLRQELKRRDEGGFLVGFGTLNLTAVEVVDI